MNQTSLYHTYDDFLDKNGKTHPIIKCITCLLEAPAASTNAKICEMCFDTDFWNLIEEINESTNS
jgi:hypothetical protein